MKRVILLVSILFLFTACGSQNNVDVVKELKNNIEKSKSYKLIGTMDLNSDEETFNYKLEVNYLQDDYYKVQMINTTNDHEQIILKNSDGLYVITPSLNKSFKFESSWPNNSSQAYILESLLKDIENDENKEILENNIIKTKVNYPNNAELEYQKIYLNKDFMVEKIEVYSKNDLIRISVKFTDIDLKAGLKRSDFNLENFVNDSNLNEEETSSDEKQTFSSIESAIYPLYMPSDTYLTASDIVTSEDDSRVILTFSGEKNFVIVEQYASVKEEHEIVPVYGEPVMVNDTIAVMSTNSMYWTNNSIDYYLVSEDLSMDEMLYVAISLGNYSSVMATK